MDFTTGQIESTNSVSSNCTIIRTDDFEQSVTLMPHSMKCVLNDLINQMVAFGTDMQLTDKDKAAFQNLALLVTKTVYVYSLLFVPEYLEQLYKRIAVEGEPLAYCIYFFVTFDHGLRQMADVFSKQMVDGQSTSFTAEMFRMCLRTFIAHSLTNRRRKAGNSWPTRHQAMTVGKKSCSPCVPASLMVASRRTAGQLMNCS